MPIRPIDVRRKEFKNSFRGYDANQVDDFLDAVADEFERSYTENARMREEISSLRQRLQQFEELEGSIRSALVHAEQAANDLRRSATQEAEDLRRSANREAELTIREAKSRSHQMLAESSARVERIQESYEALQEAKRHFTNDFRHLLKTYVDVMDNVEVASAKEIESSLRTRLDTESIAVAREAASYENDTAAPAADEASVEHEEAELAELEQELVGPDEDLSSATEDPGATQRIEREPAEAETAEAERSSTPAETAQGQLDSKPQEEVDREEPSLAEGGRSDDFFDRQESESSEEERGNSRIFRASRFLRRRE